MAKKEIEYTEKIHAERLQEILEKEDPCGHCPAAAYYDSGSPASAMWSKSVHPCEVCRKFVGLKDAFLCPCTSLGKKAIELSWLALRVKGYIQGGSS